MDSGVPNMGGSNYLVKVNFLSTEAEEVKDGEFLAVDRGQTTTLWVKHISSFWVINVDSKPSAANSLFNAVLLASALSSMASISSLFLPFPVRASSLSSMASVSSLFLPFPVMASALSSMASFSSLFLTVPFGDQHVEVSFDTDDGTSLVVLALDLVDCLGFNLEGVC